MPPIQTTLPTRFLGARLSPALKLSPSGFLLNARDGETFSLNPSGAHLLRALQSGTPPIDVWQTLVQRFALPSPIAQRDAQLFLARLFDLGLLELPSDDAGEQNDGDSEGNR